MNRQEEDLVFEDFSSRNRIDIVWKKTEGSIYFRHLIIKDDISIINIYAGKALIFEDIEVYGILYLRDVNADSIVFANNILKNLLILSRVAANSISLNSREFLNVETDAVLEEAVI